ncbi:MAG: FKBP-type peptidyl-prolyl cis-trans isomerase [Bacteroidota bacterium]
MLKKSILFSLVCLVALAFGCETSNKAGRTVEKLETHLDSVSYAIGMDLGKNFKQQGIELDMDVFVKGMEDGSGEEGMAMITDEQSRSLMMAFQRELQAKQEEQRKAQAGENLAKATEFLAQNKNNPNVTELPSGLQYEVMSIGTGAMPTINDQVTTHYHGTLLNGTVFDSSVDRGQPATFPLNGVIKAWQEILPMMKEGAKWKIYCPPALAYGEFGSPPKIGPNEALIFEIELIQVAATQ